MERPDPKNDLKTAVPKFCLVLEQFRRQPEGRVRSPEEFQAHFFALEEDKPNDQIFFHLPNEVRAPLLNQWGIRGLKAALRDNDAKVQSVVFDALVAGDIDPVAMEDGLSPDVVVGWVPLTNWWAFWRGGKLTKKALLTAFESAFELGLFDARWFLETLEARGGKVRGTEVISEGLTKADLADWIRKIHQTSDGTPKGIVLAIGWEKIVQQTADASLIGVLDSMARKAGLAAAAVETFAVAEAIASALAGAELQGDSDAVAADALAELIPEVAPVPRRTMPPEPGSIAPKPPSKAPPPLPSIPPMHPGDEAPPTTAHGAESADHGGGTAVEEPGSSSASNTSPPAAAPAAEAHSHDSPAAPTTQGGSDAPELSVFETEGLSDDNMALDLEEEGLLFRTLKGDRSSTPPTDADESTIISMTDVPGLRGKRR